MRIFLKELIFILIIYITISCYPSTIFAAERLDMETYPDKSAFNVSNMAPGDWTKRTLTILNIGNADFKYVMEGKYVSGSKTFDDSKDPKDLFNEMIVQVADANNNTIFQGNLHDLEKVEPRFLKASYQEDLTFKIEFPYELGNEYQGIGLKFEINFKVEDSTVNPPPDDSDDSDDPDDSDNPNDPNNPEKPSDPEYPSDLNDPNDPENPSDPQDPNHPTAQDPDNETPSPQQPIDPEDLKSGPVVGQILPSTSTNIFNYLLGGIITIIIGVCLFFIQRNKTIVMKR